MKLDKLLKELKSKSVKKRQEAVMALHKIADVDPEKIREALPQLIKSIEDPDEGVRWRATYLLGRVSDHYTDGLLDAIPALTKTLNDTVRLGASYVGPYGMCASTVDILGNIGKSNPRAVMHAIPAMIKCLQFPIYRPESTGSEKLYLSVVRALGKIGANNPEYIKDASSSLVKCLADSYKYVNLRAHAGTKGSFRWWTAGTLHTLANANPEWVIAPLLKSTRDPNELVRKHITDIFKHMGRNPQTVGFLIKALTHVDKDLRDCAANTLGLISETNPTQVVQGLIDSFRYPDKELRKYAVEIIGAIGEKRADYVQGAIPSLVNCLRDTESEVRQRAVEALGKIGENNPRYVKIAIPTLIECLRDSEDGVRWCTIQTLERIGEKDPSYLRTAVPSLITSLKDTHHHVRWRAARVLQKLGVDKEAYMQVARTVERCTSLIQEVEAIGADVGDAVKDLEEAKKTMDALDYNRALAFAERAEKCLLELKHASKPQISVMITAAEAFAVNRWSEFEVTVLNTGNANARNLRLEYPDFVQAVGARTFSVLKPGETTEFKLGWNPQQSGKVPLEIVVSYEEPTGGLGSVETTEWVEVSEELKKPSPPQPPPAYSPEGYEGPIYPIDTAYKRPTKAKIPVRAMVPAPEIVEKKAKEEIGISPEELFKESLKKRKKLKIEKKAKSASPPGAAEDEVGAGKGGRKCSNCGEPVRQDDVICSACKTPLV